MALTAAELALLSNPAGVFAACEAEEGRRSFAAFAKLAWPRIDATPLRWGWYADAVCDHLAEVARGGIKRLVINFPPRMGKSNFVTIMWPAWWWTFEPHRQFICASYSADLSVEHAVKSRSLIESPWYQQHYAERAGWTLRHDQNTKDHFINTRFGHRFSTGTTGGALGHGADAIIIDDPLNAMEAHSKAARDEANRFVGQVAPQRFNTPAEGVLVLVMQRLHEEDSTGFVLKGGGWEHLRLPSEFERKFPCKTFHFVRRSGELVREPFWSDPREVDGDLLFPERFPKEVLEAKKKPNDLGVEGYAAQHQQRPTPAGGLMFRRDAWRFWKKDGVGENAPRPRGCYEGPAVPLPDLERVIVSVDATFKATTSGSFVVIQVWGRRGPDRFLLHQARGRWDFVDALREIKEVCKAFPEAVTKVIEEKANGAAIISVLSSEIEGIVPFNPGPGDSKEARAASWQPLQRAGNCYLPDGAPWVPEYIDEHDAFPKGAHDDQVDAGSQAQIELKDEDSTAALWARAGG
jgi:predicted phage terminase large subunit-like protein